MPVWLLAALTILVYMVFMWAVATRLKNNGIADIGWGAGFVLVSAVLLSQNNAITKELLILSACVAAWGARLSTYLLVRNAGKPEDWRYANWRKQWGKNVVIRSLLQVFLLQGFFMFVNLLPIVVANAAEDFRPNNIYTSIGFLVWLLGFGIEAIADYEMMMFKNNPENKSRVMNQGLWRYSRHPNYFGEAVLHWGIFIMSIPFGLWWLSVIAPITITFLLLRVSGVVMLERKYSGNEAYESYKRNTSAFIPLPPNKSS